MKYVFLVLLLVVVCGGAFAIQPGSADVNPASAAASYAKHSASCHGKDGRAGTARAKRKHARNLVDPEWQARVSDERIFNSIMNGKGKMPGYGKKLSEREIDALVAHVRALK